METRAWGGERRRSECAGLHLGRLLTDFQNGCETPILEAAVPVNAKWNEEKKSHRSRGAAAEEGGSGGGQDGGWCSLAKRAV